MISLRAHGDSTGDLNDFGHSARHDVVTAVDWLEHNHPERPVVVWGQSLGAAAAIFTAEAIGRRAGMVARGPSGAGQRPACLCAASRSRLRCAPPFGSPPSPYVPRRSCWALI